jgi:hypothetical protein
MQQPSTARDPRPFACAALVALLGWAAFGAACQKQEAKEESKPAPVAQPTASAESKAKPAAPKPALKRLEWDDPKQWRRVPPSSSMRVASYQIPPVAGDKEIAELNVFVLGGDVDSNIQRWIDEFSGFDPKTLARSDRVVNDMSESVVEIPKGKFDGGMSDGTESNNFGLLGGIVTTPENAKYFFKLTGPSATVTGARAAFYSLLDSVRLEGGKPAPDTAKTIKSVGGSASPAATANAATPTPATAEKPAATAAKPAATAKPAPAPQH